MRSQKLIQFAMWTALVLALLGSLQHVAWGFASLEDGNVYLGYVQAVAVDVGLFALTFGIQQRKRQKRSTRVLWFGVIVFGGISFYANLLHGLVYASDLGLSGLNWLVSARPVLLSAALPLLVLYLSEVVSEDVQHAAKVADRKNKRMSETTAKGQFLSTPETAERARKAKATKDALTKTQRLEVVLDILTQEPDIQVTALARQLDVSRSTVYGDLNALEKSGHIDRTNGDVVVNEGDGATQQ